MTVQNSCTLDSLIEEYKQHQRRTRGLREITLQNYERFVRLSLGAALGDGPVDPAQLSPSDVMGFVATLRGRYCPHSMKAVRTALRSFLRFLRVKGLCDGRLEAAIPAVAHWRLSTLPRCLSDEQLDQLLASLDASSTPCGLRDRAIVLCLSTLGLRPGEVAALHLEDLDWRRGIINLRTRKTRQGAVVPLPRDAGNAIVEYLRLERPRTGERHVFVQHLGQRRGVPISSGVVTGAVARALLRAGLEAPLAGAYLLRHTIACRLVCRGTSLKELDDLLGHRCLDTTTIYAKLNVPALSEVALPWPEVTR